MTKRWWLIWGLRLQRLLLAALMIAMVFDPSAIILGGVTYTALLWTFGGVSLIVAATTRFGSLRTRYRPREVFAYAITFAVLLPAFGTTIYLLRHGAGAEVTDNFGRTFQEFLVLMIGVGLGVGGAWFYRVAVWTVTALAGLIWLVYGLGFMVDRASLSTYLSSHRLATYSSSHLGPLFPHIYYFTSPLLVLAGAYWLHKVVTGPKRWCIALAPLSVVVAAMMMSGTRSNVILAGCLLIGLAWRVSRGFAVACGAITVVGVAVYLRSRGLYAILGEGAEGSDAVRRGLLPAYGHGFSDPSRLIFGDGLGSCMYAVDTPNCRLIAELTPLDLLRIFGVVGSGLYAVLLALPLVRIRRAQPALWWAWLLYLAYAITSPSLFSPVGAIMIAMAALAACEQPVGGDSSVREATGSLSPTQ